MNKATSDIVILGAGPAAALAATVLARAGRDVHLIGLPVAKSRIEGASPRVVALLVEQGLDPDVFGPAVPRNVHWGALNSAANQEHVLDRAHLDHAVLDLARAAGVRITKAAIASCRAGHVATSEGEFRARHLIEARGRRAPRNPSRALGPANLALAGWLDQSAAPGTQLQSTPLGWFWRATGADGRSWGQILIEAQTARSLRPADLWCRFFAQPELRNLQKLPAPQHMIQRAAELRLGAATLDPQAIRIGDAALALDPLSGHGLFWALSSALMLPPLLRALDAGQDSLARSFYADRVTSTFWRQARVARDFYALCLQDTQGTQAASFWSDRAAWPDSLPSHVACATPRIVQKTVVLHGQLQTAPVLCTPQEPEGTAFVMGLSLTPLLTRFGTTPLPDRDTFTRALPEYPTDRASALYAWALSRGYRAARSSQPMETAT